MAEQEWTAGRVPSCGAATEPLLAQARLHGDTHMVGRALLLDAQRQCVRACHEAAYTSAFEARRLLEAHHDMARSLQALNILVAVHFETGDCSRAAEQARLGIDLAVRHGEHNMTVRFLHDLALVLRRGGEYPDAIRCLEEALILHARRALMLRGHQQRCATELARTRLDWAQHLVSEGQQAQADWQTQAAGEALPAQPPEEGDEGFDAVMCWAHRVCLQAELRRTLPARASAVRLLRLTRRGRGLPRHAAMAFNALSVLHLCAGRLESALAYERRRLRALAQMGASSEMGVCARRLADIHARRGDYGEALFWQKEAIATQARVVQKQEVMHQRLALMERQSGRRHAEAHEAQVHVQRVLVLGKLIGQISSALQGPASRLHRHVEQARRVRGSAEGEASCLPELRACLQEAVRQAGLMAELAQQLRLFSFRAMPQESVLSLDEALRSAWQNLKLYHCVQGWSLGPPRVLGDLRSLEVRADAQRLAILLKALLIGLTPRAPSGGGEPQEALWVTFASSTPDMVALTVGLTGDRGIVGDIDWGQSLCAELAAEMGGLLYPDLEGMLVRSYTLCLPCSMSVSQQTEGTYVGRHP